jgi:nucleoside-diphosphate-sugar epimerase
VSSNSSATQKENALLITGGSGFIGQNLIRKIAKERQIIALYHHKLPESMDNVFPVCSDMSTAELLAAPLRGVSTVVHLAWSGGLSGSLESISEDPVVSANYSQNLIALKNLLTAMEKAHCQRIVFVSALGASRSSPSAFLREKYHAEFLILNSKIPEKVILRASAVWGDRHGHDRFLNSILKVMKYPVYPVPTKKEGISPIHVDDLTQMLHSATFSQNTEGAQISEVCGGRHYELPELLKLVSTKVIKKTQLGVGGVVGSSTLSFFERQSAQEKGNYRLSDYLAIRGKLAENVKETPIGSAWPEKVSGFEDRLNQ